MKTAWHLSLLPYPIALAFAVGMGLIVYNRTPEPGHTTYRSSWCPAPEDVPPPAVEIPLGELRARIGEVRGLVALLPDTESAREVDKLLEYLAEDAGRPRIPEMEVIEP